MSEKENDTLGNRMKTYERLCVGDRLMPLLPAIARLDGRGFSRWTKGLKKPYDERLVRLMIETSKKLLEETDALIAYTQSDEITLIWNSDSYESDIFFARRVAKMTSVLASACSNFFNCLLQEHMPERAAAVDKNPHRAAMFDCRVFNVPVKYEAANILIWREIDATRNSVSGAAQAHFSHAELQGKDRSAMMDMLFQRKGINWNDYPAFFKRGTYIQRKVIELPFSAEEIEKLPEKHQARLNPDLKIKRRKVMEIDMPPMTRISNREEVIFDGAAPKLKSDVAHEETGNKDSD